MYNTSHGVFIMKKLYIFNPDTDYALAADRKYYTPPAGVLELRRKYALLPAAFANIGDAILLLDYNEKSITELEYFDLCLEKDIRLIRLNDLNNLSVADDYYVTPWGWDKNIRQIILDSGANLRGILSEERLKRLRELSHRRTTIAFLKSISSIVNSEIEIPEETADIDYALDRFKNNPNLYFKAPWSSSGRGILHTADLEIKHVRPWVKGIISKQGSVMIEKAYDRKLDFATEWRCEKGIAEFLGFSVFVTSRRGKYHYNINDKQSNLFQIIKKHSPSFSDEIIDLQKKSIEQIIAPEYEGPLGIDMLVTKSGVINPCVELNLRYTMGMIGLLNNGNKKSN